MTELPQSDPSEDRPGFTPEVLDKSVLTIPLLRILEREKRQGAAGPTAHRRSTTWSSASTSTSPRGATPRAGAPSG